MAVKLRKQTFISSECSYIRIQVHQLRFESGVE